MENLIFLCSAHKVSTQLSFNLICIIYAFNGSDQIYIFWFFYLYPWLATKMKVGMVSNLSLTYYLLLPILVAFICIRIFALNLLLLSKRETLTFREKYSDIVNSKNPKNVKSWNKLFNYFYPPIHIFYSDGRHFICVGIICLWMYGLVNWHKLEQIWNATLCP